MAKFIVVTAGYSSHRLYCLDLKKIIYKAKDVYPKVPNYLSPQTRQ
jgi:hypothetical protein